MLIDAQSWEGRSQGKVGVSETLSLCALHRQWRCPDGLNTASTQPALVLQCLATAHARRSHGLNPTRRSLHLLLTPEAKHSVHSS